MITDSPVTKSRLVSSLAVSMLLLSMLSTAQGQTLTLEFDSLPSNQGWEHRGAPVEESVVWVADGAKLSLMTVGTGDDSTAAYEIRDFIHSNWELSLSFTVRILDYENTEGGVGADPGLRFAVTDIGIGHTVLLTDSSLEVNGQSLVVDTSIFHDYVLDMHPDRSFEFFVDGVSLATGDGLDGEFTNLILFGDMALNENMDAEITALSFSQTSFDIEVNKSVSNAFPMASEPVEFTVEVSNIGAQMAPDVRIFDQLPAEMAIPAGTTAFATVGSYDPASGEWLIGDLASGNNAVLTVPAIVTEQQPPECIINTASSDLADDRDDTNDTARAAIHRAGVERCVDLKVDFGIDVSEDFYLFPECDVQDRYSGEVEVTNQGVDAARNVIISLSKEPAGQNLRFNDANCSNAPAAECNIAEIAAGATVTINVTSDLYMSPVATSQSIFLNVTTSDAAYDLSNNNPSATGTAGGFSSCAEIDIGIPEFGDIGPGGCFIATAAYGTPLGRHLDTLRSFRDRFLVTNRPGRALVHFYYRYSPPLADFIAERDWIRAIVRGLLTPIIYTIKYPGLAAAVLLGLIATFITWRRRRKNAAMAANDNQPLPA